MENNVDKALIDFIKVYCEIILSFHNVFTDEQIENILNKSNMPTPIINYMDFKYKE